MRAIFTFLALAAALGGCQTAPNTAEKPLEETYVPTATLVSVPRRAIDPYQILSADQDPDAYAYRAEKAAFGGFPVAIYSAYATYTYDNQTISTPGSYGTRYRTAIQGAWLIPPGP